MKLNKYTMELLEEVTKLQNEFSRDFNKKNNYENYSMEDVLFLALTHQKEELEERLNKRQK